jgi:hypothetical protein
LFGGESPMNVYAVYLGDWDSVSVAGIFSTREKAQAFIDAEHPRDSSATITEYVLDEEYATR